MENEETTLSVDGIISLHVGTFSNYVGAHFWNQAYKSIEFGEGDHSFLFSTHGDKSFAPRAIFVDIKGNLTPLKAASTFGKPRVSVEHHTEWEGEQQLVPLENFEPNPFTQSLTVPFHPHRTTFHEISPDCLITGHQPFGQEVTQREDIEDEVRKMAEECDSVKGFQVLVDADTAFGGYAMELLSDLKDSFKSPILTHGFFCQPDVDKRTNNTRAVYSAIHLNSLSDFSTTLTPMSQRYWNQHSFRNLLVNPMDDFQTSAIFASAIDTALLPCRSSQRVSFLNLVSPPNKANISAMTVSFLERTEDLHEELAKMPIYSNPVATCLTPFLDRQVAPIAECTVYRAALQTPLLKKKYFDYIEKFPCHAKTAYLLSVPFANQPPFPSMVTNPHQLLDVITLFGTTHGIRPFLQNFLQEFQEADKSPFNKEEERKDEWKELDNSLNNLIDEYSSD